MNWKCRLGFHGWIRIGITKPIRKQSEFVEREYIGHMAMGQCERCGVKRLRVVTGWWEWYHSDEVTTDEYEKVFDSGEYQL